MSTMTAAEAYEAYLAPNIFGPWAQAVIGVAGFEPGQRVLDIACGPGVATRIAAKSIGPTGEIIGIDLDDAMLAVAHKLPATDDAAPMTWRQADAASLPFPAGDFDAVMCFEGIQFFPDRPRALAEFRRVLRPGGRLIGTIWGALEENAGYHAIGEALSLLVSPEAGRLPPFALHDRAAIKALLEGAGFSKIKVEPKRMSCPIPSAREFVDWVAAGAPTTRHRIAQLADKDRAAFYEFVAERLEPLRRESVIEMPMMRHVLEATVP